MTKFDSVISICIVSFCMSIYICGYVATQEADDSYAGPDDNQLSFFPKTFQLHFRLVLARN
jgi:hypothetical protein